MGVNDYIFYDPDVSKAITENGNEIMDNAMKIAAMETYEVSAETVMLYRMTYGSYPPVFKKWDNTVRALAILERRSKIKKILNRIKK